MHTFAGLQLNPDPEFFHAFSQVNFDARGLKYHMSDHGITVIIPENVVTMETQLSVGVYYVNTCQLPEGHKLVSEVFWIKTSVPLQKNAELYVPHYVKVRDANDGNKLRFFTASDVSTDDIQALTEAPASTSIFEPGSCYGKLIIILFRMHTGEDRRGWIATAVHHHSSISYRLCREKDVGN